MPTAVSVFGTDGLKHTSAGAEESLGTFAQGVNPNEVISIKGSGINHGETVNWTLAYVSGYGNNSALSPITVINPSSGSFTDSHTQDSVTLKFSTSTLAVQTYHGELLADGGAGVLTGPYFFTITISAGTKPIVTPPANQTATEGASNSFSLGSFADPDGSPWTVAVNWGDGTVNTTFTVSTAGSLGSQSHTYAEEGTYTATITVTDSSNLSGSGTFKVSIADAALTASGTAVSATEGLSFSGQVASLTDANPTAPLTDFTTGTGGASINWGDGTLATAGTVTQPGGAGTAFLVSGSHNYAEEGSYTITVTITDKGGSTTSAKPTATIADAALTATGGFIVTSTASGSHTVATFTDANPAAPLSDFTATINWGDGTTPAAGTISQPSGTGTAFVIQGNHTYSAVTTYSFPISVSISDKGGNSASAMSTASAFFVVTGYASPIIAGISSTFTVTAKDVNGNTATGYTGTAMFSSTAAKMVLPGNYTFTAADMGVHTFSATLKTAGRQSITVTDTVVSTFAGAQSGIIVNPAAPHHFAISRYPSKNTAGVAFSFRITAQDLYSNTLNVAPFFTDTVTFTSTDTQAVLPANYTFTVADAGVHEFIATLKKAGPQGITVFDVTNPAIIPSPQASISVQPAAMSQLKVSGFPPFDSAGAAHSVTVTAQDPFGNTIPTYTGTVTFTSSDGAAMFPANYTFISGDAGRHTFMATLNTLGLQSITATDTVTSSFTGTQSNIKVQPIQPTATITGPAIGVPGQPLTFTFGASESGLPASTVYTFNVLWGDGNSQSFSGISGTKMSHTYVAPGSFVINATATDPSGNTSLTVSTSVSITTVALETDPSNSSLTALNVGGTTGNDDIAITPVSGGGVQVAMNFVNYGSFSPTGHVIVYGQSGNDSIKTAAQTISGVLTYVNVPLLIFSGNGNNTLSVSGSSVGNVLVGGGGSDRLNGGQGRDVLIGGAGQSTLEAGSNPNPVLGGAILIGGTTDYDNNAAALASVLAEWSSNSDYSTRIAHLMGTMSGGLNGSNFLNATTVHDNGMADTLVGGSGMDWFFAGMTDILKNQASGEVVTSI